MKAWLLDLSVENKGVALWLKKEDGKVEKLHIDYYPKFYVYSKNSRNFYELKQALRHHDCVHDVKLAKKYVNINHSRKKKVLEVKVNVRDFKKTVRDVVALENCDVFNIDIPLSQLFLYDHNLFPLAFGDYAKKNDNLNIELADSQQTIDYALPKFRILRLDADINASYIIPSLNDPIQKLKLNFDGEDIIIDGTSEAEMLTSLSEIVKKLDPDIIFSKNGDNFLFPYLVARASYHKLNGSLTFSRNNIPLHKCQMILSGNSSYFSYGIVYYRAPSQFYLTGRLHFDEVAGHFWSGGLDGIIEVARVSFIPLQRLTRITIGGALQAIQMYNAIKKDILIPPVKRNAESFKPALTLLEADKGGFIFEPKVGIFDDVHEFDFTSMYPTLMREYNVSPETLLCNCCPESSKIVPQINYRICEKRVGIVPISLRIILEKRLKYKQLIKSKDPKSKVYANRQRALKWILVVCFGYMGFRNARFGRVEGHQTVTAYSRELLLRAAEIARTKKLHVLHGIVDSLWLQDDEEYTDNSINKYLELCKEIEEETKIPMEYNGCYKFIVFLPTQANPQIGTLNHYYGVFKNGKIKVRGIELRRHDAPEIVKNAQKKMIEYFAKHANNSMEFKKLIPKVKKEVLQKYINKIRNHDYNLEDLLITTRISRYPHQYKNNSRQAIAAKQLTNLGIEIHPGQKVKYIITNAKAKNPTNRVLISHLIKHTSRCDVEEYTKLLKRALRNLIPYKINLDI
ncbi:MAG: DNA polymerase domain-containing protein [Candidatus Helarchaeota archaeon]